MYNYPMNHFRITYDGPALVTHEMDVRDLAPALLAIGDVLDAATHALSGARMHPQINVRASFKTGCFGIDFALTTDWLLKVRDMFASDGASSTANAAEILGALGFLAWKGKSSLIALLKWLRGRKIERVEIGEDRDAFHVDNEQFEVEKEVTTLMRDMAVRAALDKALSPLDKEGVDVFASGTDTEFVHIIRREERQWFATPILEDELLVDDVRKMAFSIVSLAFKEDNKWRLHDGAATIHATIADYGFLTRVDQDMEIFAKGDTLLCMVRVRQWHTSTGARTEYEVTEVLEHRHAVRQLRLPL